MSLCFLFFLECDSPICFKSAFLSNALQYFSEFVAYYFADFGLVLHMLMLQKKLGYVRLDERVGVCPFLGPLY
jgi:hypothetical protein